MDAGEKIKRARKRRRYTQGQLGELLGISYQTIAQWENGLREPKFISIVKIANALGINPMELLPDWFLDEVSKYETP